MWFPCVCELLSYICVSVCVQCIMLWSLPGGECVGVLRGHEHVVECVALSSTANDAQFSVKDRAAAMAVGGTVCTNHMFMRIRVCFYWVLMTRVCSAWLVAWVCRCVLGIHVCACSL